MPVTADPRLQSAMDALALPGVAIGHRLIAPGDENALRAEEVRGISESVVERRRASGAARIVARELLQRLGHADCQLPRAASGAPVWPAGVIGSLAHDRRVAVAAVADRRQIVALGIDIEPAESLPMDLLDIIATPDERPRLGERHRREIDRRHRKPLLGEPDAVAAFAVGHAQHPLPRRPQPPPRPRLLPPPSW